MIHVVYALEVELMPGLQADLVQALERELVSGPVAVVFSVRQAAGVDRAVPAFWMDVTRRLAPGLCAMAIASPSLVVRSAASGFSVANKLRRVALAVRSFTEEREALEWALGRLEALRPTLAGVAPAAAGLAAAPASPR